MVPLGKMRFALALLFVVLAANFLMAQELLKQHVDNPGRADKTPTGHLPGVSQDSIERAAGPVGDAVVTGNGINYHGGPVMKGTVNIYLIWYGNWAGTGSNTAATRSLVEHFVGTLGGTPYEVINSTYGDATGNVSGNLVLAGTTTVSTATNLNDTRLRTSVSNAISSGALPRDANGVYMVLSSSNINETSGFCTQYCWFYTRTTLNGVDIKYAFVGNPDRCPSGCEAQTTGPNSPATGIGGADGMINIITHESEEAITDPDLNAWFDASGEEDADKCNFKFGPTSIAGNGAHFNQTFGGKNWLIQMEWENSRGGGCDQTLGGPFFTN